MYLDEFYDYKNKFVEDIVTNETIVNLLDGEFTEEGQRKLVYSQVYPYEFVPDTIEEATTFICCDVDIQEVIDKTYLVPVIYVWVFTHKSKLRLPTGGVRTDKICSEVAKEINGSRFYGLGETNLSSVRRFAPMSDYQGKVMTFRTTEFNRLHKNNKPTPKNRKNK